MPNENRPISKVKVNISGEDYCIKGAASQEYIKKVAKHVDDEMYKLYQTYPNLSRTRIAVLAALNITDELFRLREEYEEFLSTFDSDDTKD